MDTLTQRDRSTRLVRAVQDLSQARSHHQIREIVSREARNLLDADGATFVLKDNGSCFYVDEDAIAPLWKGRRFPLSQCISGWSMLHRQAVVVPDIYVDQRIPIDAYRQTFVKSLVMVPIRQADPIGAVGVYWASEHTADDDEVVLAQALADTTAVALENVELIQNLEGLVLERTQELNVANLKLGQLSRTDELTGLFNRRGFFEMAPKARDAAAAQGYDSALVYFDLDGLKAINDSMGHEVGDAAIAEFAEILQASVPNSAVLARIGGDEFVALICLNDKVQDFVERVTHALDDRRRIKTQLFPLAASIGVAVCGDEPFEQVLREADARMYEAKLATRTQ